MALIKCSECGKEISTNNENCIHCGTKISINNNDVIFYDYDIETNIISIMRVASFTRIAFIILGVLTFILNIFIEPNAIVIISSIVCIIIGIILPIFIKWKAFILKNIYELNKSNKRWEK